MSKEPEPEPETKVTESGTGSSTDSTETPSLKRPRDWIDEDMKHLRRIRAKFCMNQTFDKDQKKQTVMGMIKDHYGVAKPKFKEYIDHFLRPPQTLPKEAVAIFECVRDNVDGVSMGNPLLLLSIKDERAFYITLKHLFPNFHTSISLEMFDIEEDDLLGVRLCVATDSALGRFIYSPYFRSDAPFSLADVADRHECPELRNVINDIKRQPETAPVSILEQAIWDCLKDLQRQWHCMWIWGNQEFTTLYNTRKDAYYQLLYGLGSMFTAHVNYKPKPMESLKSLLELLYSQFPRLKGCVRPIGLRPYKLRINIDGQQEDEKKYNVQDIKKGLLMPLIDFTKRWTFMDNQLLAPFLSRNDTTGEEETKKDNEDDNDELVDWDGLIKMLGDKVDDLHKRGFKYAACAYHARAEFFEWIEQLTTGEAYKIITNIPSKHVKLVTDAFKFWFPHFNRLNFRSEDNKVAVSLKPGPGLTRHNVQVMFAININPRRIPSSLWSKPEQFEMLFETLPEGTTRLAD